MRTAARGPLLVAAALAASLLAQSPSPASSFPPSCRSPAKRRVGTGRIAIPPSAKADNVRDAPPPLSSFFLPEFQSRAEGLLSPARIVEMIPGGAPPSSSSASDEPNAKPLRQELFNSPLVSALYERVLPPLWEAGLRIGGPDAEYDAAAEFLVDGRAAEGGGSGNGALLDLSCGTGFVARRFAAAGTYGRVFALDYSDKMLGELAASVRRDGGAGRGSFGSGGGGRGRGSPLSIIRGDAGRLPFRSASLDAVHWGAAMHCVPSAERALEEAHRALKPGGRLYATTFLRPFPDVVFRFFTVEEIERLAVEAGFEAEKVEVEGRGVYGILRATK